MTYEELTELRIKAHEEEFKRRERYERLCTGKLTDEEKAAYEKLLDFLGCTWDDFNFSLDNLPPTPTEDCDYDKTHDIFADDEDSTSEPEKLTTKISKLINRLLGR